MISDDCVDALELEALRAHRLLATVALLFALGLLPHDAIRVVASRRPARSPGNCDVIRAHGLDKQAGSTS